MSKQHPLTEIKGIGPTAAGKLKDAGIANVEELAKSSKDNLVKIKGIGRKSANKWISLAQEISSESTTEKVSKEPTSSKSKKKSIKKRKSKTSSPRRKPTKKVKSRTSSSAKSKTISARSEPERKKEISFTDASKDIPSFLRKRLSKKANKVLDMSLKFLKKESLKSLKKYQRTLDPERIKFNPSIEKEKNAILAIDEKSKLLEQLILNYKENHADNIFKEYFVVPLKDGDFKEHIDKLGKFFEPEKVAIEIFDDVKKRAKKKYPFSDTNFIRRIQKYIIRLYPDKVEPHDRRK
ncbi:MAG: helix-hairpin-helix domain-containing protein [Promethearchaeia archaeon]